MGKAKEKASDGSYKYGQSNFLRQWNRDDGMEVDYGLGINNETGEFDFNGDNFETPREIHFAEPEAHPLLRSKP